MVLPLYAPAYGVVFDYGQEPKDHCGPDEDRLLVAWLSSITQRYARWGAADEAERAAGAAELREVAGCRPDLLAEVAGLVLGWEGKGPEYGARAQGGAELCRLACGVLELGHQS